MHLEYQVRSIKRGHLYMYTCTASVSAIQISCVNSAHNRKPQSPLFTVHGAHIQTTHRMQTVALKKQYTSLAGLFQDYRLVVGPRKPLSHRLLQNTHKIAQSWCLGCHYSQKGAVALQLMHTHYYICLNRWERRAGLTCSWNPRFLHCCANVFHGC